MVRQVLSRCAKQDLPSVRCGGSRTRPGRSSSRSFQRATLRLRYGLEKTLLLNFSPCRRPHARRHGDFPGHSLQIRDIGIQRRYIGQFDNVNQNQRSTGPRSGGRQPRSTQVHVPASSVQQHALCFFHLVELLLETEKRSRPFSATLSALQAVNDSHFGIPASKASLL